MNYQSIITEIEGLAYGQYPQWTIGVTDNPSQRRADHDRDGKHTRRWRQWDANSEDEARLVERHFIGLGMQGGTGGPGRADYVYIF